MTGNENSQFKEANKCKQKDIHQIYLAFLFGSSWGLHNRGTTVNSWGIFFFSVDVSVQKLQAVNSDHGDTSINSTISPIPRRPLNNVLQFGQNVSLFVILFKM